VLSFDGTFAPTLRTLPIDPATLHLSVYGSLLGLALIAGLRGRDTVVTVFTVSFGGTFSTTGHLVYLLHHYVRFGPEESDLVRVLATDSAERECRC
jgi:hypothetical protein